ncbi:protein tyrosine phosphatase-like protein, putative [Plasmodium chabaudi chabaudi]|uniref:very-long-chain (3R)-3-hydroxyacyl-CoA dehydratase n=1 Tax=Plasmodium chabaudi chabaudi TaxID=31271 RepID=A0A077TPM4_PLACU|nr:protein tyrosine phosphatase-like protein, putative [Plasmodium chabaudi chabaudi]SCM05736.1 protein tyrosine phosphatase-like protein, putative [Plasmodium chabaudi chabaudi]SCM08899.1 protein tyrosine phosphatase-like protein, putative [Plasmodium chabaudi chabaudi]VTZ70463.1 protein tyrosine phosphatase-like protein, putative [Plasmodium chabaudi chabaudi]|eukprot:XP_016654690.1 protein tyrosine phosphatase, putative [Plasmodium chabaudi chabaudi]
MGIKNRFLFIYNAVSCALWVCVLYVSLEFALYKDKYPITKFWAQHKNLITITQTLAIFDVISSLFGLIRSDFKIVVTQIFSRFFIVHLIFNYLPNNNKWILSCLIPWAIIDIIRYLIYSLSSLNIRIGILVSLRNKLPLILYPIGIVSEVVCTLTSLKNIQATPFLRSFPYAMPNNLNFQIDIYYFCMFVLFLYIPGSIFVYAAAVRKSKGKSTNEKKMD